MKDITHKKGLIRVEKKEFQGHEFIDVRRYYKTDDGEWRPTPKGVTLPLDKAEEIAEAIKKELQ